MPRTALVDQVLGRLDGRLVTVVAGAGYGKTTLLRLTVERLEWPWVWFSCDERIGDGVLLLRHLAAGFAERHPGFGARLPATGSARDQVQEFCNEVVETVGEDVVLVLDDVHLLPEPALEVLDGLLRDLPGTTHLALAGREPMPLGLGRLRPGRMLEIGEGELAFTQEEAELLLEAVGLTLGPDELARLHGEVEGWVAGLTMAAQAGGDEAGAQLEYLAEEVLSRQDPEVQRFLLASSVLDRFTPAVAAAVTEREDAGELVRGPVERHLFTVRLEDGESESDRYHHLFQAFLRGTRAARRRGPARPRRLRRRRGRALHPRPGRPDIVTAVDLPEGVTCDAALWAACIGGAVRRDRYLDAIEAAGLAVAEVRENTAYRFISERADGATRKYGVVSISLLARRPGRRRARARPRAGLAAPGPG